MLRIEMVPDRHLLGQQNADDTMDRVIRHFLNFRGGRGRDRRVDPSSRLLNPRIGRIDVKKEVSHLLSSDRIWENIGSSEGLRSGAGSYDTGSKSEKTLNVQGESAKDSKGKYVCKICDKQFSVRPNLKRHHATVHLKQKPFQCQSCDKSFGHKNVLDNHVRCVHKKIRPFACKLCGKSFGFKVVLKSHVKSIHKVDLSALEDSSAFPCK